MAWTWTNFAFTCYMYIANPSPVSRTRTGVDSSWNVMAHDNAREGEWRGNWQMEWVASTVHTTSEHGVSSIITADTHTSTASSRLNWRPRRFKWTRSFRRKTKSCFLRVCHHISTGLYNSISRCLHESDPRFKPRVRIKSNWHTTISHILLNQTNRSVTVLTFRIKSDSSLGLL